MHVRAYRRKETPPRLTALALAAALALAGCADTGSTPTSTALPAGFDVQGHRGARGLEPENTLPAFETALDIGVTTLELDLHLSADGRIVVWHDPVVDPEKCGLRTDAPPMVPDPDNSGDAGRLAIASLTAEELGWFQCDRNPDEATFADQAPDGTELAGKDYRIVTLAELFEFVERYAGSTVKTARQRDGAGAVRFNIETKRKPDDPGTIGDAFNGVDAGPFELAIVDLVERFGLEDRVTIQSFDHRSLWAVHAVAPNLSLAALTTGGTPDLVSLAAAGATIWSPRSSDLDRSAIDDAHQVGLKVIPWTVNEPELMADLISMGVDGIITDRPDLLLSPTATNP